MPIYFFDYFEDGELFVDRTGTELADVEAARYETASIAAEIARDHLEGAPSGTLVEVRARDAQGVQVFVRSVEVSVDGAKMFREARQGEIKRRRR